MSLLNVLNHVISGLIMAIYPNRKSELALVRHSFHFDFFSDDGTLR